MPYKSFEKKRQEEIDRLKIEMNGFKIKSKQNHWKTIGERAHLIKSTTTRNHSSSSVR